MKLIYIADGREVNVGDQIDYVYQNDPAGTLPTTLTVTYIEKPHHAGSTGRVYSSREGRNGGPGYYPSVYGMKWTEREDQNG